MSATPAQRAAAETALKDLERNRGAALFDVVNSFDVSGGQSQDAAMYFLETTVPNAMDSLRKQLERVNTDGDWMKWVTSAEQLYRSIAEVNGYTSEWSLTGVLIATGKETAVDVKTGAEEIASAAKSGPLWGVLFALGILYVAWRAS